MDRTIVYCKSIKDCVHLFHLFRSELGDHSFYPSGSLKLSSNLLFGMYHHTTLDKHKSRILNSFHEHAVVHAGGTKWFMQACFCNKCTRHGRKFP